jgi:beta-glucanase (GH16 family)
VNRILKTARATWRVQAGRAAAICLEFVAAMAVLQGATNPLPSLIWQDNFYGLSQWRLDDTPCHVYSHGKDPDRNTKDMASIHAAPAGASGKVARLSIDRTSGTKCDYKAGRIDTQGRKVFKLGDKPMTFTARLRLPHKGNTTGLWPAFWLYSTTRDGSEECNGKNCPEFEIDTLEWLGDDEHSYSTDIHSRRTQCSEHLYKTDDDLRNRFHDYSVSWDGNSKLKMGFDGQRFATDDAADFKGQHFKLILSIGTLPDKMTWPPHPPPDSSTTFPAHMDIDWVKVTQSDQLATSSAPPSRQGSRPSTTGPCGH